MDITPDTSADQQADDALVEHFSGPCHRCHQYVDGRRHNATWNPVLGLAHADCPTPMPRP